MLEQEQSLCGKDRAQQVAARAMEIFTAFQVKNNGPSFHHHKAMQLVFFAHVVREEFSLDALWDAADIHPVDWAVANSLCADGDRLEGKPASSSVAE